MNKAHKGSEDGVICPTLGTINIWKKRFGKTISEEDSREIIESVAGFFDLLHEWDVRSRKN